ncbi:hypothetical protein ACHWQZ_G002577 [Mnemiopsis leidyi]
MKEDLLEYFESSPFSFPKPFTIVTDKDESHHRKRLLIGLHLLDFDLGEEEDFVKTIYLAHPPSIDQSGAGIAKTIHDKLVEMVIRLLDDPVAPSHKRCSVCSDLVRFNDKSHGCAGFTLSAVPSLVSSFKRVVAVDPAAIAGLSDNPEHVTDYDIEHLKTVVRNTRRASTKTLREWLKLFIKQQASSSSSIEPGMLQLLVVGCSLAPSKAIAETFGSVMEKYHNTRFFNPGPTNDDVRLQKEMFIRLNGPPIGVADSLCRRGQQNQVPRPGAGQPPLTPLLFGLQPPMTFMVPFGPTPQMPAFMPPMQGFMFPKPAAAVMPPVLASAAPPATLNYQLPTLEDLLKPDSSHAGFNLRKNYWQTRQESEKAVATGLPPVPRKEMKGFNLSDLGDLVMKNGAFNNTAPKTCPPSHIGGSVEVVLSRGYPKTRPPSPARAVKELKKARRCGPWQPLSKTRPKEGQEAGSSVKWTATEDVLTEDPERTRALLEAEEKLLSTGQQIKYAVEKLGIQSTVDVVLKSCEGPKEKVEGGEAWYDEEDEDKINCFDLTI